MKYDSIQVASFIAHLCKDSNFHYNNTKIQKLLYCCYGCVLAKYGERLCEEYPKAWQYGPVFPRVFNFIHKKKDLLAVPPPDMSEDLKTFLGEVIRVFGRYNAVPLSEWTHRKGSPWDVVVNGPDDGMHGIIPDDLIKDYFAENVLSSGAGNNAD